jgi:hypothetical protein
LSMTKPKFSLIQKDVRVVEHVGKTAHKTLAIWAMDCTERVMHYFENKFPADRRPRQAIEKLQAWIESGRFTIPEMRRASFISHTAARDVGEDNSARSAARAAGQAVATAHVPTHSIEAAQYALQAVFRASDPSSAAATVDKEREWQYRHLLDLREKT